MTNPGRAVDCAPYLTLHLSVSAVERSRARKSADGKISAERSGLHNQHRRAVDCAPYLNSAPQRLRSEMCATGKPEKPAIGRG